MLADLVSLAQPRYALLNARGGCVSWGVAGERVTPAEPVVCAAGCMWGCVSWGVAGGLVSHSGTWPKPSCLSIFGTAVLTVHSLGVHCWLSGCVFRHAAGRRVTFARPLCCEIHTHSKFASRRCKACWLGASWGGGQCRCVCRGVRRQAAKVV
jgi:hypothetical protein